MLFKKFMILNLINYFRLFQFFFKNFEIFFFFFKLKIFCKIFCYFNNFFKNFYFGLIFVIKKKFKNFTFLFFDHRNNSVFIFKLFSVLHLNLNLVNRSLYFNKSNKFKLYFIHKNVRFRRYIFNYSYNILKKDRLCLILNFNVQSKPFNIRL